MKKKEVKKNALTVQQFSKALSEHKDLANKCVDIWKMNSQCRNEIKKLEAIGLKEKK